MKTALLAILEEQSLASLSAQSLVHMLYDLNTGEDGPSDADDQNDPNGRTQRVFALVGALMNHLAAIKRYEREMFEILHAEKPPPARKAADRVEAGHV